MKATPASAIDVHHPHGKPLSPALRRAFRIFLAAGVFLLLGVLIWQGVTAGGSPDPTIPHTKLHAAILDIGVLVFREGLECILVLTALTASLNGANRAHRRPIAWGTLLGFLATLATWFAVVGILNDISENLSALALQAATGLVAILVLLVVMNWFFHRFYWSGWISAHNQKKRKLLDSTDTARAGVLWGFILLGFTSFYREGFEVVLFLQSYRLKLGMEPVILGCLVGLGLSGIVAILNFVAHRKLPYRKMLVFTGIMLGIVFLVMVGEQAQEMQLANWIPTTPITGLAPYVPSWMGMWFAVFPTVETLTAQLLAAVLVLGSYCWIRFKKVS